MPQKSKEPADEIKDMLLAAQVSPLRWERWFSDGIGVENKVFNGLNHFVMEHTRLGERFSDENPAREAIYQYPLKAVREGLINALVYRDYEAYEGTVNVEIHKDHLVISNTGGLYGGMTIERLKAGHLSAFRNPDMANYLNVRRVGPDKGGHWEVV